VGSMVSRASMARTRALACFRMRLVGSGLFIAFCFFDSILRKPQIARGAGPAFPVGSVVDLLQQRLLHGDGADGTANPATSARASAERHMSAMPRSASP
jgi:hypothetical protein